MKPKTLLNVRIKTADLQNCDAEGSELILLEYLCFTICALAFGLRILACCIEMFIITAVLFMQLVICSINITAVI